MIKVRSRFREKVTKGCAQVKALIASMLLLNLTCKTRILGAPENFFCRRLLRSSQSCIRFFSFQCSNLSHWNSLRKVLARVPQLVKGYTFQKVSKISMKFPFTFMPLWRRVFAKKADREFAWNALMSHMSHRQKHTVIHHDSRKGKSWLSSVNQSMANAIGLLLQKGPRDLWQYISFQAQLLKYIFKKRIDFSRFSQNIWNSWKISVFLVKSQEWKKESLTFFNVIGVFWPKCTMQNYRSVSFIASLDVVLWCSSTISRKTAELWRVRCRTTEAPRVLPSWVLVVKAWPTTVVVEV